MARKSQVSIHETYVVKLEGAECDYSFGLNPIKKTLDAYSEYCHPKIAGKIIRPEIKSISKAKITLIGDRRLDEELSERKSFRHEPMAVGHLETRSGYLQGSLSVPFSAMSIILHGVATEQVSYVVMHGFKLKYRQTLITTIGFIKNYEEEMY